MTRISARHDELEVIDTTNRHDWGISQYVLAYTYNLLKHSSHTNAKIGAEEELQLFP
jgi:hypothetical protein